MSAASKGVAKVLFSDLSEPMRNALGYDAYKADAYEKEQAEARKAAVQAKRGNDFEVTGDLQGVANAVEGAQLVAIAHAGSHETRLTDRGPVQVQTAVEPWECDGPRRAGVSAFGWFSRRWRR